MNLSIKDNIEILLKSNNEINKLIFSLKETGNIDLFKDIRFKLEVGLETLDDIDFILEEYGSY